MSNRPSLGRGSSWFDGPGSRPILGEPGPSTTAATSSQPGEEQAFNHDRSVGDYGHRHSYGGGASHPSAQAPHSTSTQPQQPPPVIKRVGGKANVSSACGPCKKAHLACDVARPCKRCVTMNKEDQCEDVPHKKRGRPKVNKTPSNDPYPPRPPRQAPPSMEDSKWRPPGPYDSPYMMSATSPPVQLGSLAPRVSSPPPRTTAMAPLNPYDSPGASSYSTGHMSGISSAPLGSQSSMSGPPDDRPPTFTLFCSTELKILRATQDCYNLTGYHPHEYHNLSLLQWIRPSDRHLIEQDRDQLLSVSYLANHPQSNRETHAAVMAASERELLCPAVGMTEPYPNQNVHMLLSDQTFSLFNVRIHLGGGLGGSLWQPDTLGKIYLVVSCLSIPHESSQESGRRHSHHTSTPGSLPSSGALPSFSSIAAAADAPPTSSSHYNTYHRPSSSAAPPPYYSRPTTSSSSPYPPAPPVPGPRAPSPPAQVSYSSSRQPYPGYPPPHPPPPQGAYYPPPNAHYDRRDSHPDEWRRHGHPLPSPGAPGSGPPPPDYRRGWER